MRRGVRLAEKGIELAIYPIQVTYDIAEDRLSRLVKVGLGILAIPPKHVISRAFRTARQIYLLMRSNNTKSKILSLYRDGISVFKISELLNISSEMVNRTLDELYTNISQSSPVLIYNLSDNTKEIMKGESDEPRKQTEKPDTDDAQADDQIVDPVLDENEGEISEEETIALIIALRNQNVSLSDIAKILNLEINALFHFTNLLRQHHLEKLENIDELEIANPSVKSILKQYSHIINDEVINKLPEDTILSMEYLRSKTKLSDQQLRNVYRTELLLQINLLLLQGYSLQQVADLVGYAKDNIVRIRKWYNLPNQNFGVYDLVVPINAKLLGEELDLPERRVYDIFKFEFLNELNSKIIEGLDVKAAGKEIGLSYDKTRKWVKEYNLPNTISYDGFSPPEAMYDHSWELVEAGKLEPDEGTHLRCIQVGEEVGLIREDGVVVLARDLLQQSSEELKKWRYVMYNENYEQVLTYIESIDPVEVDEVYKIQSTSKNYAIIGPESRILADDVSGMLKLKLGEWDGQSVMIARSLEGLPSYKPTYFDLFYGLEVPLRLVITEDATEQIKIRLRKQFGSTKAGCKRLGIKYRNFVDHRYLHHQDLVNLYNTFNFPNIKSLDFLVNVEKIGIKGKKAMIDNPIVSEDLFYLCGLIASDGYTLDQIVNRKSTTGFNNKVLELIDNYIRILKYIFPERHVAKRSPRPPENVTYEAVTYNYALVRIINNMTVKGVDVNATNAYLNILRLPIECVASFVRGFFDGDGNIDLSAQRVSIGIFNELRAKNFQQLLRRLSIDHSVEYSEGWHTPPRATEPIWGEKWDIRITGKLDLMRFMKIVGSNHPDKAQSLIELQDQLSNQNSLTTHSRFAPHISGVYIKSLRNMANISQKQLDRIVGRSNFSSEVESARTKSSTSNAITAINYFSKNKLTANSKELLELINLVSSDYLLKKPNIELIKLKQKLVRIVLRNNLLIDNGIILTGDFLDEN